VHCSSVSPLACSVLRTFSILTGIAFPKIHLHPAEGMRVYPCRRSTLAFTERITGDDETSAFPYIRYKKTALLKSFGYLTLMDLRPATGAPRLRYCSTCFYYSAETGMNQWCSHRNDENLKRDHNFNEGSPHQGPSGARRGSSVFFFRNIRH